ncbi:MAG: EF-hand domain-containing protein [Candidatus Thermoplasmatota archaeon]|nr:EF-hand domain-containing protein [Candidatus Thermoplasmatota archaeon]MEC9204652.1 EF-hand domain-containing protein [Candidatus Thermoplasmatota archaeon]MEE3090396.1 EF-hand domain-containing protein [Candidatus Thermoplasmatota archaeon]
MRLTSITTRLGLLALLFVLLGVLADDAIWASPSDATLDTPMLSDAMFGAWSLPLALLGVLLAVAMIGAAYLVRDERLENLLWQEADLDVSAIEALTVSNLDGDELARFAQHLANRGLSVVELFAGFDRDRSGTLDAMEFEAALREAGIDDLPFRDVDALMRTLDVNGTGQIDLPELHNLLLQHEAAMDGGEEE